MLNERGSISVEFQSSSPILVTMIKMIRSSETSVLTIATRRYIPEDGIFIVTAV
jgi:hypothetical protein